MRITKQPILLTKSKIDLPGYKLRIVAKNRQSNLVHILAILTSFRVARYQKLVRTTTGQCVEIGLFLIFGFNNHTLTISLVYVV